MRRKKLLPPNEIIEKDLRTKAQRISPNDPLVYKILKLEPCFNSKTGQTILVCLKHDNKLNLMDSDIYSPPPVPDQLVCLP